MNMNTTERKQFKSFDKVLVRLGVNYKWGLSLYSHFDEEIRRHVCIGLDGRIDSDILPYEGNEHLVGTSYEPEEEVKLKKGERAVFSDILNRLQEGKGSIDTFESIGKSDFRKNQFKTHSGFYYLYCIKFSDYNPNDMEETVKHILCVKNGKIVKYKS